MCILNDFLKKLFMQTDIFFSEIELRCILENIND